MSNKQHSTQKGPGVEPGAFQGSTDKHVWKEKPASHGTEGNQAPGKHKRGQQG